MDLGPCSLRNVLLYRSNVNWFGCLTTLGKFNGPRETSIHVQDRVSEASVNLLSSLPLSEPVFTGEVLSRRFSLESRLTLTLEPQSEEADCATNDCAE